MWLQIEDMTQLVNFDGICVIEVNRVGGDIDPNGKGQPGVWTVRGFNSHSNKWIELYLTNVEQKAQNMLARIGNALGITKLP